ncbi:LamG-like jellyroll fold domain-containing protein [Portibacter lacus]|nr:LamG-like jellyroll fold domain-containing protein [Portibacter lacus]
MRQLTLIALLLSFVITGLQSQSKDRPLDGHNSSFENGRMAFDATAYKIMFLTKDLTPEGTIEEQGLINDLKSRGFDVDVTYNNAGAITYTPDVEFTFETVNDYDLIIIGRGISSGDYTEIDAWAGVTTPIIQFSAYIMRSNRLNLMNSTSASREAADGTSIPEDRVANIKIADHAIFTGLDGDGDGEIAYHTWFHDYIGYGADTFEVNHGATLLGTWATDSVSAGNVAVAMWDSGSETYTASGTTLAGKRLYLQMGSDDSSSPKIRNYTAFTDESTLLLHNGIKMLLGAEPDGELIPVKGKETLGKIAYLTKDVDESGNLEEIEIIAELRKRGYQVDVTYNNEGSITVPVDFAFSYEALNDYDVVMLGRGVSSGDFADAADWAAVETPIIILSAYLVRNNRLNIVNSSSASRENSDGSTIDMNRITKVKIADHPVFTGINDDDEIDYMTWFYDYLGYGADTFEINHNATLLGTLSVPDSVGDGTVHMALWDAGVETYPGSGTTLAGARMYMQMGSDDNSSPKLRNYTPFTTEAYIALFNALAILQGNEPTGVLPAAGPVAKWDMSDASGSIVTDAIGGAHGEIMGGNGITWESCGEGTSINFAGATKDEAIIYVNDNPNINFGMNQSFTISLLAKIDPLSFTPEMNLILKGDNTSNGTHLPNGNGHYYTIATKDNQLRFAIDDDVVKTQLGYDLDETNYPEEEWNHIVAVRDANQDSLFLYLNGLKVASILDETDGDISTTGLPLVMGNYHQFGRKINGGIDEVAIYDFAFNASEVASLNAAFTIDSECEVLSTIEELSNDANLSNIEVSAGTLSPDFDPAITSYTVEVPEGTASVTITATTSHPAAVVTGDGEFSAIPGSTTLGITAEDGTTKDYSLSFTIEGQGNSRTVIEPGFETLWTAINSAVSGDTLVLKNGETYTPIETYRINKKIVIIAEEIPELPGLNNMPVIENLFGSNPLFLLQFGADLHLIGIDVDGQGATNIFDTDPTVGATMSIFVNRCRLHNTLDDIFDEAADGGITETNLKRAIFKNSFIYDSGSGHGIYLKSFYGESKFVIENVTFWNLGEQFMWIRHHPAGITQPYLFNHNTGYSLSTDLVDNKELLGNSDNPTTESLLDIAVQNNIFHTQLSANEGSLKFDNTSEQHNININNNVLFNVQPIFDVGGTIGKSDNMIDVDPMFVDPDNGDFTVMNSALYGGATDGEIIGATYWHPDFVDDFADLSVGIKEYEFAEVDLSYSPNPFLNSVDVSFTLENSASVQLEIYDINGAKLQTVMDDKFQAGSHTQSINVNALTPGVYFFRLSSGKKFTTRKLVKIK